MDSELIKEAASAGIDENRLSVLMHFWEEELYDNNHYPVSASKRFDEFTEGEHPPITTEEIDFIFMHIGFTCDACWYNFYLDEVEIITSLSEMICKDCSSRDDYGEEE